MHKRTLRRFAVVTGAALMTGATAVPAMANLSIGSSSGLFSESGLANDLVPTTLPASGPLVSPILGSAFGLTGPNSLLPSGVASVPSILPASLLGLSGTSLTTPLTTMVLPTVLLTAANLPATAIALVTGPTSPVNLVVNTVVSSLGILNPGSSALSGVLGSM